MDDRCPKCSLTFDVRKHRAFTPILRALLENDSKSPEARIEDSARVRCPGCGHEFPSDHVRFFGVFSRKQFYWVLVGFIACLMLFTAYVALSRP